MNPIRAGIRLATLLIALALSGCGNDRESRGEPLVLSVMTFNAWGAGSNEGKAVDETIAVLRAANADIIGLQEVLAEADDCRPDDCPAVGPDDIAERLAEALGYHVYLQSSENEALWANAILSRYPFASSIEDDLGAVLDVSGRQVAVINIHLTDYPYQPYQLLGIPYGRAPMLQIEDEAIAAALAARGDAVTLVLDRIAALDDVDAVLVTGDFNEPSHRDWSPRAASSGRHPIAVNYPTVLAFERAGFIDCWRAVYPDEMEAPGYTWTPTSSADDPDEHHDRISYVLVRGDDVAVKGARLIGESPAVADIVVVPWPSDHRAVVATVSIP